MYATLHGHFDIVATLVEAGCHINIFNKGSRNALHTAAQNGHTDIVRILLDHHADMDYQDADGNTPLLLAGNYPKYICLWHCSQIPHWIILRYVLFQVGTSTTAS